SRGVVDGLKELTPTGRAVGTDVYDPLVPIQAATLSLFPALKRQGPACRNHERGADQLAAVGRAVVVRANRVGAVIPRMRGTVRVAARPSANDVPKPGCAPAVGSILDVVEKAEDARITEVGHQRPIAKCRE